MSMSRSRASGAGPAGDFATLRCFWLPLSGQVRSSWKAKASSPTGILACADSDYRFDRNFVRLVYDLPERFTRLYGGDLTPETRFQQSYVQMGGIGLSRQRGASTSSAAPCFKATGNCCSSAN